MNKVKVGCKCNQYDIFIPVYQIKSLKLIEIDRWLREYIFPLISEDRDISIEYLNTERSCSLYTALSEFVFPIIGCYNIEDFKDPEIRSSISYSTGHELFMAYGIRVEIIDIIEKILLALAYCEQRKVYIMTMRIPSIDLHESGLYYLHHTITKTVQIRRDEIEKVKHLISKK